MNLPDLLGKVKIDNSQGKAALLEIKAESGNAGTAMAAAGKSALALGMGLTAAAAAGTVVVGVVSDMVRGFAETGSELVDLNKQLGIGIVQIQKIQYAAKQSGVEFSSVTTALSQMEKAASKTPERFAQLGISFEQVKNSKPDELLLLVSDGLKNVADDSDRTKIAMELFGRSGSQMLKMLTDDYRGLTKEAESTGLMTEEMANKADRLGDASSKLDDTIKKLKDNLGAAFASPEMIGLMEQTAGLIGLMAQNAEKLVFAAKTIAGSSFGAASWLIGPTMSMFSGTEMPDFGGVKSGASSSATEGGGNSIWGNASKVLAAAAADEKRAAADAFRASKEADEALADMIHARWEDQNALYASMKSKNEAAMPFIERAALGSIPGTLPVQTDMYGKPKQYSFDNSHNYAGIEKSSFNAAQALQTFANIAALSSSHLGKAMAQVFGSGAGVASGFDMFKSATSFLGKLGAVGSIASAGIGIISGIASLFGGGGKAKKEAAAKAAQDAAAAAQAAQEKRMSGLGMAAGGLNAFTKAGGITDQASFDRSSMYAGAIFGGQVKETGDVVGALKSIGPALTEMAEKAKELGLGLGAGISNLLAMNGVLDANGGLADQLSGLNQMMKGLGDAGLMTKDMFAAFGADASAVFAKLVDGGATGNQAMALMQPTLQQLYEGQKLHGFAVDEATQKILDQAKAEGVVGDAFMSANERIVELLGILIETLGGTLPDSFKHAGDAAADFGNRASDAINGIPRDVDVNVRMHQTGGVVQPGSGDGSGLSGGDGGDGEGGPGFASGTTFRNFGSGTRVTLHGEEMVATRPQVDRIIGMAMAGTPTPGGGRSAPTVTFGDINIHANDAQGGRAAADEFKRLLSSGEIRAALQDSLGLR